MKSWVWLWSCMSHCCSLRVPSGLTTCWEIGNNFLLNFLVLRQLDPSGWVVVPWNRKCNFSATSPVRIRSLVWIFCQDLLKIPHFFFYPLVLRQALFSFTIQAHIEAGISCSLFVNDVVTMIQSLPELCKAPWRSVTLSKVPCQCHPACDGTASPPGIAELASLFLAQVFSVPEILFRSSLSRVGT